MRLEVVLTRELAQVLDGARGAMPRATFVQSLIRKLRAKDTITCKCGSTWISISRMTEQPANWKVTCGRCNDVLWPRSQP